MPGRILPSDESQNQGQLIASDQSGNTSEQAVSGDNRANEMSEHFLEDYNSSTPDERAGLIQEYERMGVNTGAIIASINSATSAGTVVDRGVVGRSGVAEVNCVQARVLTNGDDSHVSDVLACITLRLTQILGRR